MRTSSWKSSSVPKRPFHLGMMSRSEAILEGVDGPEVQEEAALEAAPPPVLVNGVDVVALVCEHEWFKHPDRDQEHARSSST
eukprot:7991792-Alexandrium_andersonii.AAC.1